MLMRRCCRNSAVPSQRVLPIALTGALPQVGSKAPLFEFTDIDLSDVSLGDFEGQIKILSIVPSLDTSVCALSAIRFNEEVEKLENTVIVNISMDLPFANKRFCEESHTDTFARSLPLARLILAMRMASV